jgi:alkanesulfonate monooxygenase SsuD/methylene tetrahydromethanopterin reductase-like flavin-dependent oxidoreductase (luciferase family)
VGESLSLDDAWIDEFAVAGTPDQAGEQLNQMLESGADSIGLWVLPARQLREQLRRVASEVLPTVPGALDPARE